MTNVALTQFQPIRESSSPSFQASANDTSKVFGIEASAPNAVGATNVRKWDYPTNRVVRLASRAGDDFHVMLGSSTITATTTFRPLILGGTQEILRIQPGQNSLALVSSTDVFINVTLGYGRA